MRITNFLFVAAGLLASITVHAQVHRCKDATGKLIFSDKPCADSAAGGLVQRARTQEEIRIERETALDAEARKQNRRMAEQGRAWEGRAAPLVAAHPQGPAVNAWACRKAKDNYATTAGGTFRNTLEKAKTLQEEEQRVNKACGTNSTEYADPQAIAELEKQKKNARRAALEQQKPVGTIITNCQGGFCYDDVGGVYHKNGPDFMTGPGGKTCHRSGNFWNCM